MQVERQGKETTDKTSKCAEKKGGEFHVQKTHGRSRHRSGASFCQDSFPFFKFAELLLIIVGCCPSVAF